jgi:uncharacterized membrane protein
MDQVQPAVPNRSRAVRRALSLFTGTALTAIGLRRKTPAGFGLALVGGVLALSGVRRVNGRAEPRVAFVESITIDRSADEVFDFLSDATNLSRVLSHITRIEERGDGRSHWVMRARAPRIEWDAKVVEKTRGRRIAWRSLPGGDVDTRGEVRLSRAPGGRGTEVYLSLQYAAPGARVATALARVFGDLLLRDDLRRLKALLECGEIPTIDGQPRGK